MCILPTIRTVFESVPQMLSGHKPLERKIVLLEELEKGKEATVHSQSLWVNMVVCKIWDSDRIFLEHTRMKW